MQSAANGDTKPNLTNVAVGTNGRFCDFVQTRIFIAKLYIMVDLEAETRTLIIPISYVAADTTNKVLG